MPLKPMLEFSATSLDELRRLLKSNSDSGNFCFRGQSNSSWGLVPTVFRGIESFPDWEDQMDSIHNSERDCHREFRDECAKDDLGFLDMLDWLAFEQHHGAPTRLLDWTHQLKIATFFAVAGNDSEDGAVFAFDLTKFPFHKGLGRQHPNGGFDLERIRKYCGGVEPLFTQPVSRPIDPNTGMYLDEERPIPESTFVMWRPSRSHNRLQHQQGLLSFYLSFSAYDFEVDLLPYFELVEQRGGAAFLYKVTLPCSSKESIRLDLCREGIDEFSVYGGMDNLGKRVARRHQDRLSYLGPNRSNNAIHRSR
jgi:hypothetical protein